VANTRQSRLLPVPLSGLSSVAVNSQKVVGIISAVGQSTS